MSRGSGGLLARLLDPPLRWLRGLLARWPVFPWIMEQRWRRVVSLSWPVDPGTVAPLLPRGAEPDLYDGRAWVTLLGLEMEHLRPRGLPAIPLERFAELNFRTYVRWQGQPGVVFLSIDGATHLGTITARSLFDMPFHEATGAFDDGRRFVMTRPEDPEVACAFDVEAEGPAFAPEAGTIEAFLADRFPLYAAAGADVLRGNTRHTPWAVRRARVHAVTQTVTATRGVEVEGTPTALVSEGVDAVLWPLARLRALPEPKVSLGPRPWNMRQQEAAVSFLHYPVDPGRLASILPTDLGVRLVDGRAWVAVIGLVMADVRLRHLPPVPGATCWAELDVFAFVEGCAGPAVWFLRLYADRWLPVVGAVCTTGLPYVHADLAVSQAGDTWQVRLDDRSRPGEEPGRHRVELRARPDLGPPSRLAEELTAQHGLYAHGLLGGLKHGRVHHAPWPLQRAEAIALDSNVLGLFDLVPLGPPEVHVSAGVQVEDEGLVAVPATSPADG